MSPSRIASSAAKEDKKAVSFLLPGFAKTLGGFRMTATRIVQAGSSVFKGMWIRHQLILGLLVAATFSSRRLTVTKLGRFLSTRTAPKHAIKRVNRFLSSRFLDERGRTCVRQSGLLWRHTKQPISKAILTRSARPLHDRPRPSLRNHCSVAGPFPAASTSPHSKREKYHAATRTCSSTRALIRR